MSGKVFSCPGSPLSKGSCIKRNWTCRRDPWMESKRVFLLFLVQSSDAHHNTQKLRGKSQMWQSHGRLVVRLIFELKVTGVTHSKPRQ